MGRWISEDPLGFAAGDANVARYVGNGVVFGVDPTGLFGDQNNNPKSPSNPAKSPNAPDEPPDKPVTVDTLSGVPVYFDGLGAGTPSKPIGDGKHINIGGEKENSKFEDYDMQPGHPPSFLPGYKRPFTSDLPDDSVSHFVLRNTPLSVETWREILRLKTDKAIVTIAGPKDYIRPMFRDLLNQKPLRDWVSISRFPTRVRLPVRKDIGAEQPPVQETDGEAFSIELGPKTSLSRDK